MQLLTINILKEPKLKIFLLAAIALLLTAYWIFIHSSLTEYLALKKLNINLNEKFIQLSHKTDSSNPLQHDPLLHVLIKYAEANQLEIITTKFNKLQNEIEEFSCEVQGSYPNTIKFIINLFNSPYALVLKELQMDREAEIGFLKSQLIFSHHV